MGSMNQKMVIFGECLQYVIYMCDLLLIMGGIGYNDESLKY